MSENYFQHADHFTRILNEQEKNQPVKVINNLDKNKENNPDKDKSLEEKTIIS